MTTDTPADELAENLANDLADLVSAEDFLDYFDVTYERHIVQVNRLHILQRFHDSLGKLGSSSLPTHAEYRDSLAAAYNDFVHSDAITEKVFKVLKRASGITTIPLSAIGRVKR